MSLIRIATRKSPLALYQANYVGELLTTLHPDIQIEIIPLVTSGDKLQTKLKLPMNKGLFVKELEDALLEKRADIAVHSLKDVPSTLPNGLSLPVMCKRHSPYDALISREQLAIDKLHLHAVVGTSSLRRQAQLLVLRPDFKMKPLRGNVQTRLDKLFSGEFDAIVLAEAGLKRLNLSHCITQLFSSEQMLPACGQGALGIECREDDAFIRELIQSLHDRNTALCVEAERTVNRLLGGNCSLPFAVFSEINTDNTLMVIKARVLSPDGKIIFHSTESGPLENSNLLALRSAENLINQGALTLLQSISSVTKHLDK